MAVVIVIAIIMWVQSLHPLLRGHIFAIDVITMVLGAVCQQANTPFNNPSHFS